MTIEYPKTFKCDVFCETNISAKQLLQVKQHLQTVIHLKNVAKKGKIDKEQSSLTTIAPQMSKMNQFAVDVTKCFTRANIPLAKLKDKNVVEFFDKYINKPIPSDFTLRSITFQVYSMNVLKK